MLSTTFDKLKEHGACESGYKKLATALGGATKYGRTTRISLLVILESNGVDDCTWALRAAVEPERDYLARMIGADCAESVLHLFTAVRPNDDRPMAAIQAARAFARGEIDESTWDAAWDAAWAAAGDAAWDAAWDAEREKQAVIIKSWLTA